MRSGPLPTQVGALEFVGAGKIRNDLRLLIERLESPGAILEAEFEILEKVEEGVFEGWAPSFDRTGAAKASLTQRDAEGAIRRAHGTGIDFGTSVWYVKFQRRIAGATGDLDHPVGIGGERTGKPRGRRRTGRNLLLRLTPEARRAAAAIYREALLEGLGE